MKITTYEQVIEKVAEILSEDDTYKDKLYIEILSDVRSFLDQDFVSVVAHQALIKMLNKVSR